MGRAYRFTGFFGALLCLAACQTTTLESQTKTRDARQARIYFLRSTMTIGGVGAEITVDGQKVGALANSSYFFIDREPGRYTMTVNNPLEPGRFEATIQIPSASTYYIEVSQRREFMAAIAAGAVAGAIGGPGAYFSPGIMSIRDNSGRYKLTLIDDKAGTELLERLKR